MKQAALVVRNLGVKIQGKKILEDVNFLVSPGQWLAIIGPNGAGKSVLVRALIGVIPSNGRISVARRSLKSLSPMQRAQLLSYVPQRSLLQGSLTVSEVIEQGRFLIAEQQFCRIKKVQQIMHRLGIENLASRWFPSLSGGEQQLVLIARALATEAKIMVLDEPTSSLDIRHQLEIYAVLQNLAQVGFAIISVLHDLQQARQWTDSVLVLQHGRVLANGPTQHMISQEITQAVFGVGFVENQAMHFHLGKLLDATDIH